MTKQSSIFTNYAVDISQADNNALKDHPQLLGMIDILSRKEHHHLFITDTHSEKINIALMQSLLATLIQGNVPKILQDIEFIYFDSNRFILSVEQLELIEHDFATLCEEIQHRNKIMIFVMNHFPEMNYLGKLLQSIITNPHWRLIVLSDQDYPLLQHHFTKIKLIEPTQTQILRVLNPFKTELERFHHVTIPEETGLSALSMASHYLHGESNLDKAIELLDSAAARTSATPQSIVTTAILAQVVSSWTQIPFTNLHNNKFQAVKLTDALQRRIFGQDAAITMLSSILQHACIKLQEKSGPLCNFLLVGSAETGKAESAYAMAEHLFGHKNALLHVTVTESCTPSNAVEMLNAIQQIPYAIVLIENIHLAPAATFNLFKQISMHGFMLDEHGNKLDFRHAIIVVTTTFGSDRIAELTQIPVLHDTNEKVDLIQLVLNDTTRDANNAHYPQLSTQELSEELISVLEGHFSANLLQHLHIVPFLPLDYSAFEKIMLLKLKAFSKRLETHFGCELVYAPEVIKFLAQEALNKSQNKPLEKLLEQHVYSSIANEILAHAEDKNRPKRLMLALNEDGQLLRCEFITANEEIYV